MKRSVFLSLLITISAILTSCNNAVSQSPMNEKPLTIAFYLQDRVEILDFAGPLEVFNYAGFEVFTVSVSKEPIKAQGVLTVTPDFDIESAPKADILAFFGGNSSEAADDPRVINWLKEQTQAQYHFSVCTGAFMLANGGVLDGKTATTFHDALDRLEKDYPQIDVKKNARYIDNGNVITTAGVSAGIDGALHLVAKLKGFETARRTAYYMEYDKWTPGEGLILSEDNPYKILDNFESLAEYEGEYEFREGQKLSIQLNRREKGLEAVIDNRTYPLFFRNHDQFADISNGIVLFERDENGEVTGYSIAQEEKNYRKLN